MQRENDVGVFILGSQHSETSMVGNLITGTPVFPQTPATHQPANNRVHNGLLQNRVVSVANGPDIRDAQERATNCMQFVLSVENFINTMSALNRFIVFIFVLQFGCRISEEDIAMIKFMIAVLGDSLLEDHTFIAMTGGDRFEREHGNWQTVFLTWCQNQQAGYLRDLMANCRWRVHLFGDMRRDEAGLGGQLQHLMNSIDNLRQEQGEGYSRRLFDLAADSRQKAIVESRKWVVEEEMLGELDRILLRLRNVRTRLLPSEQLQVLDGLKIETTNLVVKAKREDRNTEVLMLTISRAELANRSVCDAIDVCKNDIQSEHRMETTESRLRNLLRMQARNTNLLILIGGLVSFLYRDNYPLFQKGHSQVIAAAWVVISLLCWFKGVRFRKHVCALVVVFITYCIHEYVPCLRVFLCNFFSSSASLKK